MSKEIQVFKPEMEVRVQGNEPAQTLLLLYGLYLENTQEESAEQLILAVDKLLMSLDLELLLPIGNALSKAFIDEMDSIAARSGYVDYDFIDYFLVGGLTH